MSEMTEETGTRRAFSRRKWFLKQESTRDVPIDTLRGIAIILMVAGHVIGGTADEGMQVGDDSTWRIGYLLLADLRIPLFTALSGFVYALRPLHEIPQLKSFFRGKGKRLMFPLVSVGTVFTVLQALTPGTNTDADATKWWTLYFYGSWHFWFLQAIFILLAAIGLANACGALATQRSALVAIGVTAIAAILVRVPFPYNIFSVNGAIRLAPFFLLGYVFSRFWRHSIRLQRPLLIATGILFPLRAAQIVAEMKVPILVDTTLGLALGLVGIGALIACRRRLGRRSLAALGYFSFAIYLLHVFGTAVTRILLEQFGVDASVTVFALGLIAGLALPILFEISLGRVSWVSWLFLGQKPYLGVLGAGGANNR